MDALFKNRTVIFEQVAFWLFMFLFIVDYHFTTDNGWEAMVDTTMEISTYAVIVYFNLLVLIPALWQKGRHFSYGIGLIATIWVYIVFMRLTGLEFYFYVYSGWRNVFSMILNTALFLLISLLYWYFKRAQREKEQLLALRSEKLESELNFLRIQFSPHFLFNTLNNIYTLAIQKHDQTAPMVAKLSTILRHFIYDCAQNRILLAKELDTLQQFIDLHLLRRPASSEIVFEIEGEVGNWDIAPMILIGFVENAFKHSQVNTNPSGWIKIRCGIQATGQLQFVVENSRFGGTESVEYAGIGLQNTRRQLEINYPNAHQCVVQESASAFSIITTLTLDKRC